MTLTGRVPLLLLSGWWRCCCARRWARPGSGVLVVALLVAADVALAPRPGVAHRGAVPTGIGRARVRRRAAGWSSPTPGRRAVAGVLRDAWQPTAGARGNRHRLRLAPGDRTVLTTPLLPTPAWRPRAAG